MGQRRRALVIVVAAFTVAVYLASDALLPHFHTPQDPKTPTPTTQPITHGGGDTDGDTEYEPSATLPGWGYNSDRNVPRWRAIAQEIRRDLARRAPAAPRNFTLVDYGADQGYFSISCAKAFPQSRVIALEMGGVGGEIWKKEGDVLATQEAKMDEFHIGNVRICQAKVEPWHFFELNSVGASQDYQLVLSVFHWFELPTRVEFERTVVALLNNSRTTFLELPTMGDASKVVRRQVGWKYFSKWYDGRSSIKEIIEAAGASQGMKLRVKLVVELPWIAWTRQVFRVDVVAHTRGQWRPALRCAERWATFGCAARSRFDSCDFSADHRSALIPPP